MNNNYYERIAIKYRNNLALYGKQMAFDNPDRLPKDKLVAVTERIFSEINKIDMAMGYEYHETGVRLPATVSIEEQNELFVDFIDWYQVIETPSAQVLDYVLQNYPVQKYPRILCVGDGQHSHLGRKLAMNGYTAVSVDPVARKEFSSRNVIGNNGRVGKFKAIQAGFYKDSEDMINWANVIVGAKVPICAEDLVQLNKPTVFNISGNPEMYNMSFNGISIKSEEQLRKEISKCKGVEVHERRMNDKPSFLFVRDERNQER